MAVTVRNCGPPRLSSTCTRLANSLGRSFAVFLLLQSGPATAAPRRRRDSPWEHLSPQLR
eukprot:370815-Pyramimonas_sp.AAC.1